MSSNITTTTNSNTNSSILRKRFREEIADETIQPPMKRMRLSAESQEPAPQQPAPQEQETAIEVVERVKYTLVKSSTYSTKGGTVKPWGNKHFKTKKYKCKRVKVKKKITNCEFFD